MSIFPLIFLLSAFLFCYERHFTILNQCDYIYWAFSMCHESWDWDVLYWPYCLDLQEAYKISTCTVSSLPVQTSVPQRRSNLAEVTASEPGLETDSPCLTENLCFQLLHNTGPQNIKIRSTIPDVTKFLVE